MKWFYNMKISAKILSGFILVALIAAVVGIIGIININNVASSDMELYSNNTIPIKYMGDLSANYVKVRMLLRDVVLDTNKTDKDSHTKQIDDTFSSMNENMKQIYATCDRPEEKTKYEDFKKAVDDYIVLKNKVIEASLAGRNDQALLIMRGDGATISKNADKTLGELSKLELDLADGMSKGNQEAANSSRVLMILILAAGMVAGVVLGLFISGTISKPVRKLVEAADRIALGDVNINIESSTRDEVGTLMESFRKMSENVKEQASAAQRIAEGELTVEIKAKSEEDVLSKSLIMVKESLKNLVSEAGALTRAALDGKLSTRGDTEKFKGGYRDIVDGVNKTLDAVIEPVKEASVVLQEMAKGNLKVSVKGNYKGDHAEIKNSLNSTISTISVYINDITRVLSEIAAGNLTIGVTSDYMGDFVEIKNSLNMIVDSLNEVLSDMNSASEQVAEGARQVSASGQALSQGSTEQASVVEELTSSLSQIAVQTKQNATNAKQANELSLAARDNAAHGNKQMDGMLKAMAEINESSGNISKIIKVIDEIAFQTNILALNAAVEAARAGQHGKGFAVVAEEVRNLAARSADAAKETTMMIEGSIKKVEDGTKIASATAEALNSIVEGVAKATALVGEIAVASNDQATGIAQVDQGIAQVSQVTQTNSATAEESAAASEELSSQAQLLKELVSKFRLKNKMQFSSRRDEINSDIAKMIEKGTLGGKPNKNISLDGAKPFFGKY